MSEAAALYKPMTTIEIARKKLESEQSKRERIQDTRVRILMDKDYVLKDWKGNKIDDAYPVNHNLAATFAEDVIQDLVGAKWQDTYKGDISPEQNNKLFNLVDSLMDQTDETLRKSKRINSLGEWNANHICHTGLIGVRWVAEVVNGQLKIICKPCDMLNTPFEYGSEGLDDGWICPVTWRTWYSLMKDYPFLREKLEFTKELIQVWDWHDAEKDELWVGDGSEDSILVPRTYMEKPETTLKHNRGYVRFVVAGTSSGFMIQDKNSKKHEDEDILFLIRKLLDTKSRNETIKMTVSMKAVRPAYEQQLKNPANAQKVPKDGQTLGVPEDGMHQIVDTGDIKQASMASDQSVDYMISRGAVASTNNDRQGSTPPSALLVLEESEMRSKRHTSRKNALQYFREDLIRLMLRQITEHKGGITIGRLGNKSEYKAIPKPEKYTIKCRLMTKSKKLDYTNMMVGMNALKVLPPNFVYKNIMMLENPDIVEEDNDIYRMRRSNPIFDMYCQAFSSIRKAEKIEKTDPERADYYYISAKTLGIEASTLLKARKQQLLGQGQQNGNGKVPDEVIAPKVEEGKDNPGNTTGALVDNVMSF